MCSRHHTLVYLQLLVYDIYLVVAHWEFVLFGFVLLAQKFRDNRKLFAARYDKV